VANGTLAARRAVRDLRRPSEPLAKVAPVASRAAAGLNIGDVFAFARPELGMSG